jgi:hypothetical protein
MANSLTSAVSDRGRGATSQSRAALDTYARSLRDLLGQ